jgi:hypothetical protein
MPSAEAIASLDPATRKRFTAVQEAARENEAASAATKQAQQAVADAVIELRSAEEHMRQLRPPVSAVDAARIWIETQRRG